MSPGNDIRTPAPTALNHSQVFKLKSSRPTPQADGQPLSPVPDSSFKKSAVTRKYTRRKSYGSRRGTTSRSLKENSVHSRRSSVGHTKEALIGRPSSTQLSRSWKQGKKRDSAHSLLPKSNSQASLASPFNSQPPSPALSLESTASNDHPKRALGDSNLPAPKRRNSGPGASSLSLPGIPRLLPSALPPSGLDSPSDTPPSMRRKGQLSPSSTRSLSLKAKKNLLRMPSHPVFDTGVQRLSPQIPKFTPTSSLGFINFNRPPSQLSIYDTKLDEDFLVPVKGLDSLPTHDLFASGLAMASTPFKTQGLFELEQSSPGAGASIVETYSIQQGADKLKTLTVSSPGSHSHPEEPVEETAAKEPENLEDLTESMSLTSVEDGEQCHHDLTERSSWITDSLISPPTIYLKGPRARPSFSCGSIFSDSRSGTNGTDSVNQTSSKELSSTREDREEVLPATPEAEGSKPLADNPPTRAPGSIARTRRGTVTQVPSAPPSIRRPRSGTITQDAHPVPSEILDPESGGARITRARSNTIRPAATTTTATGTLIGLQKATSPTLDDLAVFPTFAPDPEENSHGADEALGCSVHVDAEFDPEPVEVLVFASAPNPDVEDDIDDEPTLSAVQQASRSSDVDPLNLGYEPQPPLDIAQDDSPDDEAVGTSKPTSKRRNLRWAPGSMTTRKGKGKQQQQKQSGAKPKSAPKGLKKALGLLAKRDNSDSYDRSRSPSTDPIDFLSHLDDSEDHGDARVARARDDDGDVTGEKQAERPPKKKSLSVRWEDVVGAMG